MEDFIYLIGRKAADKVWLDIVMDDILVESLLIYTVLQVFLTGGKTKYRHQLRG